MRSIVYGTAPCTCGYGAHEPLLIALTGGPGGGKTAVLEVAARILCEHVAVLPEAASIAFGGGFPRHDTPPGRESAQRVIFHIQREMERLVVEERKVAVVLCDRGTVDGLAYWPAEEAKFWSDVGSSREAQLERYAAVIHLRTPSATQGYDHSNALRIEPPAQAHAIDERIFSIWSAHPHHTVIESQDDFLDKVHVALRAILSVLPPCCRSHTLPARDVGA